MAHFLHLLISISSIRLSIGASSSEHLRFMSAMKRGHAFLDHDFGLQLLHRISSSNAYTTSIEHLRALAHISVA